MNRRAFVLGVALVLLGNAVAVALRAYAEAVYLGGAGRLPPLLLGNALGLLLATLGYDAAWRWAAGRGHGPALDRALLLGLLAAALAAPRLLAAGAPTLVVAVGLIALSQVAGLALWNRVAAAVAGRDARRMLPRAGAAVTAGGALAGLGAGALIPRVGLPPLPYLAAAGTAIVVVLAALQARALAGGGAPGATLPAGASNELGPLHRRLLVALIGLALLDAAVGAVVELQFGGALKARYAGEALATALALFYGGTSALLLVLQVAAVPRLLVSRSLPVTLGAHAVAVIGGAAAALIAPGLGAIALLRTADQVLRPATSRPGQEVSLSALPPGPRARWKVLLRGVAAPAGAGLASLGLLVLAPGGGLTPPALALITLALALPWWLASQLAARRFVRALAAPLGIRAEAARDPGLVDLATLSRWVAATGDPSPAIAALARAVVARARLDAHDLADELRHDDAAVRAALFEQLARDPSPALRGELRAAVEVEDDDHALARGQQALALLGDAGGLARGDARAPLSAEVAAAVATARLTLHGEAAAILAALPALCGRDPAWATALLRRRGAALPEADLAAALTVAAGDDDPARRDGALLVIARIGPAATLPLLVAALEGGVDVAALLDDAGARHLAPHVAGLPPLARAALARGAASAPAASRLIAPLLPDPDPEVGHAAVRGALALARGGAAPPAEAVAVAHDRALAALGALLDVRDVATDGALDAAARTELDVATRRAIARLCWLGALEAAAAGREAAALTATARHLLGGREPDRRRALDVLQELGTARPAALAAIERWLRPPAAAAKLAPPDAPATARAALAAHDPWLATHLGPQADPALARALGELRRAPALATVAGPALAELAATTTIVEVTGGLFAAGERGDDMYVVTAGALVARRGDGPPRALGPGAVVGELAVLSHAPRATTVTAEPRATVRRIPRAAFERAARRAPELLAGLTATLASWLEPDRPDVLP